MTVTVNENCIAQPQRKAKRKGLWASITAALALQQQRRQLKDLDEHLLRDIGITRQDAEIEAEKPIWDVPRHWSR